ncbi:MAG: hypothetical protein HY521_01070 [Proteobacteria bacterium]|nr:hypothetical protein [Pseudomonadota bacterium]
MGYNLLYRYCQSLDPPVNRNKIRDETKRINGISTLSTLRTGLDTTACRGFYLSAQNKSHKLVQQFGTHVIAVARGLDRNWERFIFVKEMMHLFDDSSEATDTGAAFERLLTEMVSLGSPEPRSAQLKSEVKCFWMALGVLCPENSRQQFKKDRESNLIDDYEISLRLRIPEQYVQHLFRSDYLDIVKLLNETNA